MKLPWQSWNKPKNKTTEVQTVELQTDVCATEVVSESDTGTKAQTEPINTAMTQVESEQSEELTAQSETDELATQPQSKQKTKQKTKPRATTKSGTKSQVKSAIYSISKIYRQKWIYTLVGLWAVFGAIATTANWRWVQLLELQSHGWFFTLRGSVEAPDDIIILAIDDTSLFDGESYLEQPQRVPYFEPIQSWPWKREAYAIVVQKLLDAGAKTVAIDIIFDKPSVYGTADDRALQQTLAKYPGKIVLAALYEGGDSAQGSLDRFIKPDLFVQDNTTKYGSINYYYEPDGKIHRFGDNYLELSNQYNPQQDLTPDLLEFMGLGDVLSFDRAVIEATGLPQPQQQGEYIYFFGGAGTFQQVPFSEVIDPENWKNRWQSGKLFQNKIVLIGATHVASQDFHGTPTSASMAGIEVHAHAIASLLEHKSIREAIPYPLVRGLLVFISLTILGLGFSLRKIWTVRMLLASIVAIVWLLIAYIIFVYLQLIIPTTIPLTMLLLIGFSTATLGGIQELSNKFQLRQRFKHYVSSPIIQEILKQQQDEDFQELLEEAEKEILEKKLGGRYKLISKLAAGGFGQTYMAEDTQRPHNPKCVVKKLAPATNNPKHWELAKRLFRLEAETLEKLGRHPQIPELLADITEDEEFYLVQEFIPGEPLQDELPYFVPLSEPKVVILLSEILSILEFVHSQGVIHRDIKPENIIRRNTDNRLVLIDFGVVKEIENQMVDLDKSNKFTIAIGTQGYTPPEQAKGSPRFNSDIYATGMIAVKALTLQHPATLEENKETGEAIWENKAKVSPELASIINKMICPNFRERYQSTTEVLTALQPLLEKALAVREESTQVQRIDLDPESLFDPTIPWSDIDDNGATDIGDEQATAIWQHPESDKDNLPVTDIGSDNTEITANQDDATAIWVNQGQDHSTVPLAHVEQHIENRE